MKASSLRSQCDRPVRAWHARGVIHVELEDGEKLSFPVKGNRRLEPASATQRNNIKLLPWTLHWPDVDEDLTIEGIKRGDYGQHVR